MGQIKQPFLLIDDLIFYVTFLNFWLIFGFLMQEVENGVPSGSAPVTAYHRDQITLGTTLLSI